ncbi:oxidoreductase [Bacillus sp. FJAT-27264]|uniref:SDR family oxidoreductase n=1 Tax=Paenibacillus sp. (strain DSM 101736 / FJAT-27264) TaxID=1850362 RepID=UPI0008080ED9|nr:SDR family oxidoreductase [Bacillus sp. FJAT-27264]OBZ08394.1 oxidoreductase [Bacillus sp. FJAT-27264]
MNRLEGKIAIVTGASRRKGIGTAICRALAREGADLFFTHLSRYDSDVVQHGDAGADWADQFSEELRGYNIRVQSMELDLSEPDSHDRLLREVEARLGTPAILVNNATHSVDVDFRNLTNAILDAHYGVNVRGTCMLSAAFARHLEGKQGGRIINLVSGQDKGPMPGNLAYVATKGAISAFTVSLAAELAPLQITVNAVDPGPTDSGWMNDEIKQHLLPKFPMGRLGQPEDAARLITFLASDEAAWVTGQIIHSDGGFWG